MSKNTDEVMKDIEKMVRTKVDEGQLRRLLDDAFERILKREASK